MKSVTYDGFYVLANQHAEVFLDMTKNDHSMELSCPQNRTARRVASKDRLGFGKLSMEPALPYSGLEIQHFRRPSASRAHQ